MDFPYTSHDSPTKKCPDVDQDSRNILSLFSQIFPRQSWAQFLCKAWLAASVTPQLVGKWNVWRKKQMVPGTFFFCMEVCIDDNHHDDDNVDDEEEDQEDKEQK